MINKQKHSLLKITCKNWRDYIALKMGVDTYGSDCSCGCYFFIELQDSGDWGVCCNPESMRAGLLTWEHMGCPNFSKTLHKWVKINESRRNTTIGER